jgi:hypothetical protein
VREDGGVSGQEEGEGGGEGCDLVVWTVYYFFLLLLTKYDGRAVRWNRVNGSMWDCFDSVTGSVTLRLQGGCDIRNQTPPAHPVPKTERWRVRTTCSFPRVGSVRLMTRSALHGTV